MTFIAERMPTVALVLMRVSGIVFVAPPFGGSTVPPLVRGVLALVLTLLLLPVTPVWNGQGPWAFAAAALSELLLGLGIGFLALLLLLAVQGAGDLIDMEMGFGVVNVIDPAFERPVPLVGSFLYVLALLIFFAVDGHLLVIQALLDSFRLIPPGGGRWEGPLFRAVVDQFAWVIVTAVRVGLPVIGVLFLSTVALGVLARTMPQLNVFLVGIPLKIALGTVVLAVVLPALSRVYLGAFDTTFAFVDGFIRAVGGR